MENFMSGTMIIAAGIVLIIASTAAMIAAECFLQNKKRKIREQVYQIYD
ncbi:MAG: hypothetical protein Q4B03_09515 [Lachnospiraceae bacterium]|nr:hypothetical protein [Lachnospiraceae bacterium]